MGVRTLVICLVGALAASCQSAAASPPRFPILGDETDLPSIDPVHTLDFQAGERLLAAAFDPEGETLYIQVLRDGINLWALCLAYWPEWLGLLAGLIAAVMAVKIARRLRLRERPGTILCRRCGYGLTGLASPLDAVDGRADACPECGVSLARRPPRAGRSAPRRIAFPAIVLLAALGGYGALHGAGVPRVGALSDDRCWIWPRFETLATGRNWTWAHAHRTWYLDLLALDTATGQERRIRRLVGLSHLPMALSPDGRTIVLSPEKERLEAIDAATGRRVRRIEVEPNSNPWVGWYQIVGFSSDSKIAFVARVDGNWDALLAEWDLRTGEMRPLVAEPAYRTVRAGVPGPAPRRFALVPSHPGVYVSTPDFVEASHLGRFVVHIHGDRPPTAVRAFTLSTDTPPAAEVAFSPTDPMLLAPVAIHGIDGYDLFTGEWIDRVNPPGPRSLWFRVAASPDGARLFAPVVSMDAEEGILVRDAGEHRWAATLRRTSAVLNPEIAVSPNGRWIAAWGELSRRGAGSGSLLWYDLSPLDAPAPHGAGMKRGDEAGSPE